MPHAKPVLVVISSKFDHSQLSESLRRLASSAGVAEDEVDISKNVFFKSEDLPLRDWAGEVDEVCEFLRTNLRDSHLHIALTVPSAFALAVGAKLSSSQLPPLCIYHFQSGAYHRVIDITDDSRKLKGISEDTLAVDYNVEASECDELAVIVQFASHSSRASVQKFIAENGIKATLLEIRHRAMGNLPLGDWSGEVREIYSVIQKIREKDYFGRMHFFLSAPVAISFGLGLALGTYVPLTIYQYDPTASDPKAIYQTVFRT